jgi:hypothetical protein
MLRVASAVVASTIALTACSTSSSNDVASAPPPGVPTNANPGESPPSKEKPKDPTTQITVGIDAEDFSASAYRLTSVEVIAKIDGLVAAHKTFDAAAGPLFPHEVHLVAPQATPDAMVEVTTIAHMNDVVVVTRRATTRFVPRKTKLVYVVLELRCNTYQLLGGGDPSGPTCTNPGETCIGAKCRSDALADLPDYAADWATNPPSRCGSDTAAEVVVGKGESAFAPVVTGETLPVECGPQGGNHVWLALHMKTLRQIGTVTTVSASQPGVGGAAVAATAYPYSWSPVDGGSCELIGLRFQLDTGATRIDTFLGKPLDITVNAKDKSGHDVTSVAHVNLAAIRTGTFCH